VTVDIRKVKRGDRVEVDSPLRPDGSGIGGSASGDYRVLEVNADADAMAVVRIGALGGGQVQIRSRDILDVVRPHAVDVDALPNSRIRLRPAVKVEVAAPVEEPAPKMVNVLITNRREPIEITRGGRQRGEKVTTTRYRPGRVHHVDRAGQPHMEFEVDSRDVAQVLSGHPAYLVGQNPGIGFLEED
jgi:hypothetical protein